MGIRQSRVWLVAVLTAAQIITQIPSHLVPSIAPATTAASAAASEPALANAASIPATGADRSSERARTAATTGDTAAAARAIESFGSLPMSFEANLGQASATVDFVARGQGYVVGTTAERATLWLQRSSAFATEGDWLVADGRNRAASSAVQMLLVGADPAARAVGDGRLPGHSNYFIGNDPANWRTNVPTFSKVRYTGVWPGIDVVYYGNQRQLEFDFLLAAGADPNAISMRFVGAPDLVLTDAGDLLLRLAGGEVVVRAPVVYQEIDGQRQQVSAQYMVDADRVRVKVGAYDLSQTLIIDPVIGYSTYLGGTQADRAYAIAVDANGNAYVVGTTSSGFAVVEGSYDVTANGLDDVFVTKLNASGAALVYSTYIGGTASDHGYGIALDGSGNAYVTGLTVSTTFPMTDAAHDTTCGTDGTCNETEVSPGVTNRSSDAFVTKLDTSGSALVYSTYLGGSATETAVAIAVGADGSAHVTGTTASTDFDVTNESGYGGGTSDAFVTKLAANGGSLVYSTYLGGSGPPAEDTAPERGDRGKGIAVDQTGNAYVTGETDSPNFPTTEGALFVTHQSVVGADGSGFADAFVTKLSATGVIGYSTFLGGDRIDGGAGISVDTSGNAYVTGFTASLDGQFPTTPNGYDLTYGFGLDAFVSQLNADGSALVYSTYLGGTGGIGESARDLGLAIATGGPGHVWVLGATGSALFPTVAPTQASFAGGLRDAFVAEFDTTRTGTSSLVFSTYLGGSGFEDENGGIALGPFGNAYVAGDTRSSDFPTTSSAHDTTFGGVADAFVVRFATSRIFVVDTTDDGQLLFVSDCFNVGPCRLRDAIAASNDNPARDTIQFNIGTGVRTIAVNSAGLGPLPELSDPVILDGFSQPGAAAGAPKIVLDGSALEAGVGLVVTGGNTEIRGLVIHSFPDAGVHLLSGGNQITGSWIGLDSTGAAAGNLEGIVIEGQANEIGETDLLGRNVVSGNANHGVLILSGGSNLIHGNFIGTNATGDGAVGNGNSGVHVASSSNRVEENVISGNQDGVELSGGSSSAGNVIRGNRIGTNAAGTASLPNGLGIASSAADTSIGGTTAGQGNIISGNNSHGIALNAPSQTVQGNFIGTNAAGTAALGNGQVVTGSGILVLSSTNLIGGTAPGARNLISGNNGNGVVILGSATGNVVQGNFIGTNATGVAAIGNTTHGVQVDGAADTTVGGTTSGARNVISGNGIHGVSFIKGTLGTPSGAIRGNYVGLGADGASDVGNGQAGIVVGLGEAPEPVPASIEISSNTIGHNGRGIEITRAQGVQVIGNGIGVTAAGAAAPQTNAGVALNFSELVQVLSNVIRHGGVGVFIQSSNDDLIQGNDIRLNVGHGVVVDAASQGNQIRVDDGAITNNGGKGILLETGANGGMAPPQVTGVDTTSGLAISGTGVAGHTVDIHADADDEGNFLLGSTVVAETGTWAKSSWAEINLEVFRSAIESGTLKVTATATTPNPSTSEFSAPFAPSAKVAYVYARHEGSGEPIDIAGLNAFKSFLEGRGFQFDQVSVAAAASHDFTIYDAIIVGHDTGDLATWGTTAAVDNIVSAGTSIVGIGEGGYAFFGRLFQGKSGTIGWGNGWHTSGTGVVVVDGNDAIWDAPNAITPAPTTGSTVSLYSSSSPMVSIHVSSPASTLTRIGREVGDNTHHPLIAQNGCYLLWGFDASPATMTTAGKDLFENALSQSCTFGDDETVTFTPDVVPPGGTITVTVAGLSEGTSAAITLVDRSGETTVATLGAVALTGGGGTAALVVPEGVASGDYKVRATAGAASALSANRLFVPVDYANYLWLNPKKLTSGVQTPQHIWRQGQNAWYVIEDVPAEALIEVELEGPDAADYNVNLYADIFAAYAAISQPQDPQVLQSQFAPENFSPENFSPENFSPENFSPENFSPENFSPENFSPENFSPENFSPENFSPENFSPENFSPENFSPTTETGIKNIASYTGAQWRSFITFSSHLGTSTERIVKPSWLNAGNYFIRVRGRDGGFSLTETLKIKVTVTPSSCGPTVLPISLSIPATPAPAEAPKYKTLIVTDLSLLDGTATEKETLRARIATFAARPEVAAKLVDLGELVGGVAKYGRVAAARAQAVANKECAFGMSILANEIDRVVETFQDIHPLQYVVLIGNDRVIPFSRIPDRSELALANERRYEPPVLEPTSGLCDATACLSRASLKLNYVLSQDQYGTRAELWRGRYGLPVPHLPVGRLVEDAIDATGMLDAYLKTNAGVVSLNAPALVTGYDFLSDGALDVQFELETGMGTATTKKAAHTLIQPVGDKPEDPTAWTADQLREKLLNSGRHDIVFLAGHFSAIGAQAADYQTRLASREVLASTVDLENTIVFSAGCHSGYNIVNLDAVFPSEPDWAQTFNRKRATFIGGTGYQYGDTDDVLYGEWLYREFSRRLRAAPAGPISVGNALVASKRAYFASGLLLRGIDEKTVAQATLFGLPMLSVNMTGPRLTFDEGTIATQVLSPSRINATITPALTAHTLNDLTVVGTNTTIDTTYLSGMGSTELVVADPGQAILPLELRQAPISGNLLLRGVGLDNASYSDSTVYPATSSPATELSNLRSSFDSSIFVPVRPWRTNYIDSLVGGPIRIGAIPAQVVSDLTTTDPLDATLRTYGPMTFRLCYSNSSPTLAVASLIAGVSGTTSAGGVSVSVQLNGAASEVWVTYTGTSEPFYREWASVPLTSGGSNLWTGTIPLGTQVAADVRYIVQAFGPECLFSIDTNLGRYYTPDVSAGPPVRPTPTKISLVTPPLSGVYGQRINVVVDLDTGEGAPLPGQPVTVTLGSQTSRATTGANGQATLTLGLHEPQGAYELRATFAGSETLLPDSATSSFGIGVQSTLLSLAPTTSGEHRFIATLSEATIPQNPMDEATVIFVVRSAAAGTPVVDSAASITNVNGQAELRFTDVSLRPGVYTLSAYFLGTIDLGGGRTITLASDTHGGSAAGPVNFTVGLEDATVSYTGQLVIPDANALALSANVTTTTVDLNQARVRYVLRSGTVAVADVNAARGQGLLPPLWAAAIGREALSVQTYTLEVTEYRTTGGWSASATETYIVAVYDASAGFVTGGGWIDSPAGAYASNATLTGRANFGFVAKFQKGQDTPSGNTEFQFSAAGLSFKSTSYEWLVVSGAKGQYKGAGKLNGVEGYTFMLTATDGQVSGGGGVDKFRVKIIHTASGNVVYDNKRGTSDDLKSADPQAIAGGSIVIHK